MFEAGIALINQGIALIAQEDLSAIPPVVLGAHIKQIHGAVDRMQSQSARRIEQFDRERGYAATPDSSTVSWLRNNCHVSGATADKQVKLARQLPRLVETVKAVEAGQIGIEHA